MGDSKGGEPVLMSYSRRYTSVAATSNEEVSQIRRRSAAVISNSVDGSRTLPSSSKPSLHELKKSRQTLQLRLKQTELEETANSLASCRHYPITFTRDRRSSLAPVTPSSIAATSGSAEIRWEDYWDERKQVEKNTQPIEDRETDIDDDINERQSHAEWLKQSGFAEAAECVDRSSSPPLKVSVWSPSHSTTACNQRIDVHKVRERTRTMKLSPADTATVLKKVKRANAVVKPGLEAATNGKPSPDRESSSHLSSSLESSAELEAQRPASPEDPFRSEYFQCVSGDADSVDCSIPLPVLSLGYQPLGVTCIDDMSREDQDKLRHVAVISLTALLDNHDLHWKTGRPLKRKSPDAKDLKHKIFGIHLKVLLERDRSQHPQLECPLFFHEICDFLSERGVNEEGILRKPGSEARMKKVREELDEAFSEGRFSWENRFPHDCATLLKQFLRELPVALLTEEYLPMFETIENLPSRRSQIMVLNLLTLLLPEVHRACLKLLLQTLYRITTFEVKNRMGLSSVAMIIAPNLFRHRPCSDPMNEAKIAARESYLAQLLIVYHDLLFIVPNALLEQLRSLNDMEVGAARKAKNVKEVKKVLDGAQHRKQADSTQGQSPMAPPPSAVKGVLKVFSPQSIRVSRMMGVTGTTTVTEILVQFCKRSISLTSPSPVKPSRFASSESIDSYTDNKGKHSSASTSTSASSSEDVPAELTAAESSILPPEQTPDAYHVYECFGNIGYRRLADDAVLVEVQKVNPTGSIVIVRCDTDDVLATLKSITSV